MAFKDLQGQTSYHKKNNVFAMLAFLPKFWQDKILTQKDISKS